VIGLTLIVLLILVLLVTLTALLRVAANRRWEARAEAVRIDREVRRAEHQLHNLAIQAFAAMLDSARSSQGTSERSSR
jgi:hypothetical protein